MKTSRFIQFFAAVLLVALAGCTHNEGDIGIWFGTWHVDSATAEGVTTDYQGGVFLQFQTTLVCARATGVTHPERNDYGRWTDDGSVLTIEFPDEHVAYDYVLRDLGMDLGDYAGPHVFEVTSRSSKRVTLVYTDASSRRWTLVLNKL